MAEDQRGSRLGDGMEVDPRLTMRAVDFEHRHADNSR